MSRTILICLSMAAFAGRVDAKEVVTANVTFEKLGQIVESEGCPKDFTENVSETITRLCTQAKRGEHVEAEGYLNDDDASGPEIDCKYENEHFAVIFTGTPSDRESILTVQVDDKGQILKIIKDQLEVSGKSCQDLASRIDKGGRIPASVDTELCFDYFPAAKLTASRDRVSCSAPTKTKPDISETKHNW